VQSGKLYNRYPVNSSNLVVGSLCNFYTWLSSIDMKHSIIFVKGISKLYIKIVSRIRETQNGQLLFSYSLVSFFSSSRSQLNFNYWMLSLWKEGSRICISSKNNWTFFTQGIVLYLFTIYCLQWTNPKISSTFHATGNYNENIPLSWSTPTTNFEITTILSKCVSFVLNFAANTFCVLNYFAIVKQKTSARGKKGQEE